MKFKDLEVGQGFHFGGWGEGHYCYKISPGSYHRNTNKGTFIEYVGKRQRGSVEVFPHSEPPSSIEAAKRDRRWYLFDNMEVTAAEARAMRERDQCGLTEAVARIKKQKLIGALDTLRMEIGYCEGSSTDKVLHDLIEIVRELV